MESGIVACNMQATNQTHRKPWATSRPGNRPKPFPRHLRSPCPIANLLDLVGDKWSLLVVRDLLRGQATYSDLLNSPEKIPTNLLADRLKRLEKAGILARSPYQKRPIRYAYKLTDKGKNLRDVLTAFVRWSKNYIDGVRTFEDLDLEKVSNDAP